jgi:hypothetical protein
MFAPRSLRFTRARWTNVVQFYHLSIFRDLFYKKIYENQLIFYFDCLQAKCDDVFSSFFISIMRIMDLNRVMIIGRATNNLQVKTIESSSTPVVNFTVATNRKYKNKE